VVVLTFFAVRIVSPSEVAVAIAQEHLSELQHRHQHLRLSLFVVGPPGVLPAFVPLHPFAIFFRLYVSPLVPSDSAVIVADIGFETLACRYVGG